MDRNIYQAVKGIDTAAATVKQGGVIIMAAESVDGHGGRAFYEAFGANGGIAGLERRISRTPSASTAIDQWQVQIMLKALKKASIIYVSGAPANIVRGMRMTAAGSLEAALRLAEGILAEKGKNSPTVLCIPDGVSVIIR
jgi:nickel-dependent lactate racemase